LDILYPNPSGHTVASDLLLILEMILSAMILFMTF